MSEELLEELKVIKEFRNLPPGRLREIADITAKLRSVSLFDSLSTSELAGVAESGVCRQYEPPDFVIREGDTDKTFYVIVKGQVRVWTRDENGHPRLLNYHETGDFFGELAPLNDAPRAANVDVVDDVELVAFEQEGFDRIAAHPQISEFLRSWGQERMRRSNQRFPGKHWDEITVVLARKSWVALIQVIFFPIAFISLTLVTAGVLYRFAEIPFEIVLSLIIAITVGMCLWIFWMWEDWRNDDFIVTSKRIIHIERILVPPFPVERHEAFVEQVQDITTRNHGLWTRFFDIHSLEIQTAGAGIILFPYLGDADLISEEIFRARNLALTRRLGEERSRIRQRLHTELDRRVVPVVPMESGEEVEVTPERTGLLRLLDYFVPRTRIVKADQIIWRKHWVFLIREVWVAVLLFFFSLVMLFLALVRPGILQEVPSYLAIPLPALSALVAFCWYLWRYDGWRNDVYIVTDTRIIDIEGSPFHLQKESRKEGTFDVIQNTEYSSPNWFLRILRIGNVEIRTAAQQEPFTFDLVPRPEEVQQEIFKRLAAYRENKARQESEQQHAAFAKWFGTYHRTVAEQKE